VARVDFALPDVGEGLEEGEIVSWLVGPGDTVARDQPLVEVQTDKALVELPSPVAGQIVSLAFGPGDIVKVGQVLVVLEDASPPSAAVAPFPAPPAGRPKAAPTVRRLALDRGIDLASVTGSGPGGRILAADVEAATQTGVHPPPLERQMNAGTDAPASGVPEFHRPELRNAGSATQSARGLGWMEPGRHPLRGIRRVTAEAMARSWSEIPHLTTIDEIDASGLLAARRRLADAGIDTTVGALLVAAVARGLRRFPLLNTSLELAGAGAIPPGAATGATPPDAGGATTAGLGGSGAASGGVIVVHPDCNVGLAVATAEGLVVPVVRQADRRSLADLGAEVRRLTAGARNRTLDVAELRGGTFTISNYGALGGRYATPLIRPGEVGIMGFGAIRPRPIVVDGEVRARPTLPWSLSADHRLIDGDLATAFAEYVTGLLADPIALLAELLGAGS
jgi:pyruvate dehydrogenase E2 component (dihydrolipoamide acetyltransferase)